MTGRRIYQPIPVRLEPLEGRDVPAVVGGLDPSFGVGGLASFNAGGGDVGLAAVTDAAGRVVVAGFTPGPGGSDFLIERLTPDGALDATFGTGGRVVVDFSGAADMSRGVSLDPAGNILVAGRTTPAADDAVAIARLTPAGVLDGSFGTGGKIVVASTLGTDLEAVAAFADATGNIVVGVTVTNAGVSEFAVGRVTTAGGPDPTFGTGGKTSFHFGPGTSDRLNAVVRDAAGNIIVVGSSTTGGAGKFAAARLLPGGLLDTSFGTGGLTSFNLGAGTSDQAVAAALDSAGRVVVVGRSGLGMDVRFGVARLTAGGALDPTFSGDGLLRTTLGGTGSATGVVIQPGDRIVVGGSSGVGSLDFAATRLLPDGSVDTTFNPTGPVTGQITVDFAGGTDFSQAMVAAADGRIVLVGYNGVPPFGVEVARLIGTVEKGERLAVAGGPSGRAEVYTPDPATGAYGGTPVSTPASVFPGFAGAVRVAEADVNGDHIPDVVLVTGPGTPVRVAVVSGADNATVLVAPFDPFGGDFTGGGFVAAGDLDHDGRAEVAVTPDQGGGPRVTIFSLRPDGTLATRANFLGIDDANFRGGARAAAGDVNGDGTADLAVAAGFLGGPRVALFDGKTLTTTPTRLVGDFFAFPGADATNLRNGAYVAAGDVDGDGFADLIFGGGPGGAPRVFVLGGQFIAVDNVAGAQAAPVANFFVAGNTTDRGGIRVAVTDADGDHRAEVVVGSGEGVASRTRVYLGKSFTTANEPATAQDLDPYGSAILAGGVFVG